MNFPSISLFVAPPKCGKSHLIKHLIHKYCGEGRFDYGVVVCSTVFNDGYDYVPSDYMFALWNDEILRNLMRIQKQNPEANAFLILDDIAGTVNFNTPTWQNFITCYRHYRITVFIASQYIKLISTTLRTCVSYVYVFGLKDQRSLREVWECFATDFAKYTDWVKFLRQTTAAKYQVLFIDVAEGEPLKRYKRCKAPAVIPQFRLEY